MHRRFATLLRAMALTIALTAGPFSILAGADEAESFTTATPIKYLVIIFQENESFDHYFGTYPKALNPAGEPRFVAASGTPSINGLTPTLLTFNPNGVNPFRYGRSQVFTCTGANGYMAEQQQFDAGLMDKFPAFSPVPGGCPDYGHGSGFVMGYFDGNSVTALWKLCAAFCH